MAIVAEFSIPTEAVPGGTMLAELPDATIQLERIVPAKESALPFFWVFHPDLATVCRHLKQEPEIHSVTVLADVDTAALFRAEWTPEAAVIEGIKSLEATILEATGSAEEWMFQVRAEDRERLSTFQEIFTNQGIPVEIRRVFNFAELVETGRPLTPEQHDALVLAYEQGYYEKPRQISQDELGEAFGISGRAVSDRLRRGTRNLITSTILTPQTPDRRNG